MNRPPKSPEPAALEDLRTRRAALLEALDQFERIACPASHRRSSFPAQTVRGLCDRLAAELAAHADAREVLLAPLPAEPMSVEERVEEDAELVEMLEDYRETLDHPAHRERDEQLRVQASDLVALLRSQLRKEETLVFAIAARAPSAASPKRRIPRGDRS